MVARVLQEPGNYCFIVWKAARLLFIPLVEDETPRLACNPVTGQELNLMCSDIMTSGLSTYCCNTVESLRRRGIEGSNDLLIDTQGQEEADRRRGRSIVRQLLANLFAVEIESHST